MVWPTLPRFQKTLLSLQDYTALLQSCIKSKSASHGKLIHQHFLKSAYHITLAAVAQNKHGSININLISLLEKLTHFYVECNGIERARRVFDEIPLKPKSARRRIWNLLIREYAWSGPFSEAIDLYHKMVEFRIAPNKFTFPFVLKACSALRAIDVGREIHAHATQLGLDSDVFVSTALVDMYGKCGCLTEAQKVFGKMPIRDVVAWNSMIAGFSLQGGVYYYDEAIGLLLQMQNYVAPNSSTIVAILPVVAQADSLRQGKGIHGFCLRRNYNVNVVVETGILDMYGKCKCISYAKRIFDMMTAVKNEVTWSAMIGAYVTCGFMEEALQLFHKMMIFKDGALLTSTEIILAAVLRACAELTDSGTGRRLHCYAIKSGFVLDLMLGNTLLSMYAKCGLSKEAVLFFNEMVLTDTVSFNAIISGCVQNGNAEEALQMFHKMQLSGIDPDLATMLGLLPACSHLAARQLGTCSHAYAVIHGFNADTSVCNALIDMYAKCGRIDTAKVVFDSMPKQDIVSWNTMILAYGIHGLGIEALSIFNQMNAQDLKPDGVTFICLLSACSHSGLVTEGKHWFNAMTQEFEIIPRIEHYICMSDLLSRAGLFEEAQNLIKKMPFEPDVRVWGSLLSACRVHKNIELGEEVSKKIQILGPESTGNFVLLSNMYSTVGRWDEAAEVRTAQRKQGFLKSPGCSWIEIGGVVHAFIGGDRSHAQSVQINEKLDELLAEMKNFGYRSESSYVLQDVEEEEKEGILLYHGEKLAVAFGILYLGPNKPIFVTKNLRVCGDCHTAIKFISLVTNREITVRDASRFHHFRDGICNCGDFW